MRRDQGLRIGILGCSYIAPISVLQPATTVDGLSVAGVAARDAQRARSYAEAHGIPKSFASYDALITSDEVDLIYIALPPVVQGEWARRALEAGKHVLVEKPMCLDVEEAKAIARVAADSPQHILEAVMVQHHGWQARIREMIQTREYGALRRVHTRICSEFGELAPTNFRRFPQMGGGVLYDEAPYWLQFVQRVLGLRDVAVDGRSSFAGPRGLDWIFEASLRFEDEVEVTTFCSYAHPREASHLLEFDDATVEIKNFFRPVFGRYKFRVNITSTKGIKTKEMFGPQNYYENQLQFFTDVIRGARENLPIADTVERIEMAQRIMDVAVARRRDAAKEQEKEDNDHECRDSNTPD